MARVVIARTLAAAAAVRCSFALTFDVEDAKNRPVSKVVALLKGMSKQLEKEAAEDEEIYEKMACWCKTNDREKTKSIADAETHIAHLQTKMEELTALSAQLTTQIGSLEKEVETNQNALNQAIALREKQLAEFNGEEKDMMEAITALTSAVNVLKKHNTQGGSGFLQMPSLELERTAQKIELTMTKHAQFLAGVLTHTERKKIAAFIQHPSGIKSYNSQSGAIYGILNQMSDEFKANLAETQATEHTNQQQFMAVSKAKKAEISAGESQINKKTELLADTDETNAQSKEDHGDTTASLTADEQFLSMLKEKCQMTDSEWEERTKTRQLEIQAVSGALAVLTGDDAHDLFSRTFNKPAALIQTGAEAAGSRRAEASGLLSEAAGRLHSPRLATLAYRVKLDAFDRVKKAIDDMVSNLLKEKADEITKKDTCIGEFDANELQTEKHMREHHDVTAKMEDLEMSIKTVKQQVAALQMEISEMQVQMKRAGEDREAQNKEFQTTVADQRQTQHLLDAAMRVLGEFYSKNKKALAQVGQEPVGPPPPAGFDAYTKNEGSSGVMKMIQQISEDAKAMEAEAIRSEEDAQKAYESFVKETNASIETKSKAIVSKSAAKADMEIEFVQAKTSKEALDVQLEQMAEYKAELKSSCDFVLKNFDVRQTARDEEVEALKQAKAILSGAQFSEFLQKA